MITPDLQKNLVHTAYALFIHNYIVFAYFFGFLIAVFLSIVRPRRFSVLLLLGFAILTFSFEYDKHIIDGLREQTIRSLVAGQPHYRLQSWLNLFIGEVLPVFFYLTGWFLIYLAIIFEGWRRKKKT